MYSLSDFEPYEEDTKVKGEDIVLAWSRETGYYFVQFGFLALNDHKVIAIKVR